jgi:hypothetical protein
MPNKCLRKVCLQILDPKKNLSRPKMNESFEINLCQEKQHHKNIFKKQTHAPKKKLTK